MLSAYSMASGDNALLWEESNIGILKRYADNYYKLVSMKPRLIRTDNPNTMRVKTVLADNQPEETENHMDGYSAKILCNIARAKSRVFEIAICNPFEYYFTLTVDAKKCNRVDLDVYYGKLSKWLNNYNNRKDVCIKHLSVPEQHKNGAWHIHGVLMGLPESHIEPYEYDSKLPRYIKDALKKGRKLYRWRAYEDKFGWMTMEPIRDNQKCAGYISKYITKQAENVDIEKGNHLYYCSKGLKRAEVVYKNTLRYDFTPDYVPTQHYVKVKVYEDLAQAMLHFVDSNELTTENDMAWKEADWKKYEGTGFYVLPDDVSPDLPPEWCE